MKLSTFNSSEAPSFGITETVQIVEFSKDTLATWIRHGFISPIQGLKGKRQVFQFTVLHLFQLAVMKILVDNLGLNLNAAALIAHQLFPDSDKSRNEQGIYYLPGTRVDSKTGMLHIEIPLEFKFGNPREFKVENGTRKERKKMFVSGLMEQKEGRLNSRTHGSFKPDSVMTISINPQEIKALIMQRISKYVK